MAGVFSFVCSDCGKTHTGSPSWSFASPLYWSDDLAQEVSGNSMLDSHLCVSRGTDFFIRCTLEIPIHDASEPVTWGVWATQSKANFKLYHNTFYSSPERTTFGYLANRLPGYADTLSLAWPLTGKAIALDLGFASRRPITNCTRIASRE